MIDWSRYTFVTEPVSDHDGGGYRCFCPVLGYAVYGVGDTIEETAASLEDSKAAFERFAWSTSGYVIPSP